MSDIPWLDDDVVTFPAITTALDEPNGLLAAGGNLQPATLLSAYRQGVFPWYNTGDPILWWTPDPRTVIFPEQFHVSHSLRKRLRRREFTVTADQAFGDVMTGCQAPRNYTDQTWIVPEMHDAYCALHAQGHAHSIDVWQQGELVGGIYGVAIGHCFFGESMFSHVTDASKVAIAHLVHYLQRHDFRLLDCQMPSPHLSSLGAVEITRNAYRQLLDQFTVSADKQTVHHWDMPDTDWNQ